MSGFRRVVLAVSLAVVMVSTATIVAYTATVESGTAVGAGWSVVVPDVASVTLTPSATASVPTGCDPAPATCEAHESNSFANAVVGDPLAPAATANALLAEAHAYRDADGTATLQSAMDQFSGVTLPTGWNTVGYSRLEGVSLLNGAIIIDSVEAESVSGTRVNADGETVPAVATGVRIVNLRLGGVLATETLPSGPWSPGQVLLDAAGIRIVYWHTNWNTADATASTTPAEVIALWVTDATTGADIRLAHATATSTASPEPEPSPSESPTDEPTSEPSPSESPTSEPSPSESPTDEPTAEPSPSDEPTAEPTTDPGGGGGSPGPAHNEPPVAENDDASTTPGGSVTIRVTTNDSDPNGDLDESSVTVIDAPDHGVVSCQGGWCTYTAADGFTGTDTFTYRVCDHTGLCDIAVVTITVTDGGTGSVGGGGNEPPIAENDDTSTPPGQPVTIDVTPNDNDPDGDLDESSVVVLDEPDNGTVSCVGGVCTYTPDDGFTGTDTFTYRVCDDTGQCDTAVVAIAVGTSGGSGGGGTGGNHPPVAENDSSSTDPGQPVTIDVTPNDDDPDGDLDESSVTVIDAPDNGTVTCTAGSCTYTPNDGFTGTDSFTYAVCDATGQCDTAVVTIVVGSGSDGDLPGDGTRPGTGIGPDDDVQGGQEGRDDNDNSGGGSGNDGSGNGGSGNGGGSGSDGPGGGSGGGSPTGTSTSFGIPRGPLHPSLPFTGGSALHHLAVALNLMVLGGLLTVLGSVRPRVAPVAGGASAPAPTRPTSPDPTARRAATPKPSSATSSRRNAVAKNAAVAPKYSAKKSTVAPKRTVKKSTVARKATSAKATPTKKPSPKKSTVAKKPTAVRSKKARSS